MNQEIKARWLEALRSGKYQQGRDGLRDRHNRFCCLGVLADLMAPTSWEVLHEGDEYYTCKVGEEKRTGNLPTSLRWEAGLGDKGSFCHRLVVMNDTDRQSFSVIADYIEEQL